jgi:polyisoprenoid-binding protein YceI
MLKFETTIFALIFSLTLAQAQVYVVSRKESKVNFTIKNLGVKVDGCFKVFEGEITLNMLDDQPSVTILINSGSVDTGISLRDQHLKNIDYFDILAFPEIKFVSKSIDKIRPDLWNVTGELTIKSMTKEISFPVKVYEGGHAYVFNGKLKINRIDYNIGHQSFVMADDVDISFSIKADEMNPLGK